MIICLPSSREWIDSRRKLFRWKIAQPPTPMPTATLTAPYLLSVSPTGRRNNFKLLLSICGIHFNDYQESLNRFPLSFVAGWLLRSRAGKKQCFLSYYYLFSEWNSFVISSRCHRPFHIIGFLNEIFLSFLRNFYRRFFYCHIKLRQFLKFLIFLTLCSLSKIRIFCHIAGNVDFISLELPFESTAELCNNARDTHSMKGIFDVRLRCN